MKDNIVKSRGADPGAQLPRAETITAKNIVSAYVLGSRRQQRRGETYGRANYAFLRSLTKRG